MNDAISRQAAIDEIVNWLKDRMTDGKNGKPLTDRIKDLPSIQAEIIRCKDCKHLQKWRSEESAKKFGQIYECARNVFDCPKPEDFCSHAEKRIAQPKRIRGQWERIPYSYAGGYRCSICGCKSLSHEWNFCPNCGADMRGEKDG